MAKATYAQKVDFYNESCQLFQDGKITVDELVAAATDLNSCRNCLDPIHDVHAIDCPLHPDFEYPHNPENYTCPGQGIKCLCGDIDHP
jgi:hypothetical protein